MGGLRRFRGHFYNWYDTQDLRPLNPQYVSSVDSGNLAGHLIALANACREWIGRPLAGPQLVAGIEDGLNLTRETLQGLPDDRRTQTIARHELGDALDALAAALRQDRLPPEEFAARLVEVAPQATTMVDIARTLASERGDDAGAEMLFWAEATQRSIESHRRDLAQTADAARSLERRLATLEATARTMADAMEFGFLLDPDRKLLSLGYRVAEGNLDPSCYDLLASEACLASFVAIAKGDVASRHWFRLGRAVTPIGRGAALISLVGVDVRVSDAVAHHARTGRQPARADEPSRCPPADRLWRHARCALGDFGIRLQRPRPGVHLSIFELRVRVWV